MTPRLDFKEISNRDAWSTIRGFVYQVDFTILRWLELKEHDLLELERGEDIDLVQRDLAQQEISRELEQVKYREGKVTLNTDLTLELLKNFYDHKINNPGRAVSFRFLTNAEYAQERPALFTNGDKGIERWIKLYDPSTSWENNETVSVLQKHIQKKITEQFIPLTRKLLDEQIKKDAEWKAFHSYLDDPGNLKDFILTFEWAGQKEDQISIVETVLDKIRTEFKTEEPKTFYERLFVFVFKLLSSKGIKQLDAKTLRTQGLESTKSPQDRELVGLLRSLLSQVDQRLRNLEQQSDAQSKALNTVFKDVEALKYDAIFSYRLQNISTSAPGTILNGTVRAEKVKEILDLLNLLPWLAFHGINGSGKTQMASLVSKEFQDVYWLDLREYQSDLRLTALAIEFFLATISNCHPQTDKKEWVAQVIANLPEGSLLIFNDVPRLDDSVPGLIELFRILINLLETSSTKLITTSNFHFPNSITHRCSEDSVFVYEDFEFNDKEITEYLVNQGATDDFLRMVPFIAARAHRNPQLTTAMIQHLKSINWGADRDEVLDVVMSTEFAVGVLENAQQAIIKYIVDQSAKELLYRLSLISWTFGMEQVQAVSKVEQEIIHPNEKLQSLLNLWIQLRGQGKYEISPLIQNIGVNNLDQESVKNIHRAIGESILASKSLNQFSANRAFMAFLSGKDFDNAGMVLLKMYEATTSKEEGKILDSSGMLLYWTSTDFPTEMGIGMKVMIRREQLRLYKLIDRDISKLLEKTNRIFEDGNATVPEEGISRLVLVITYFEDLPVADFFDHMSFVLKNLTEIEEVTRIFDDFTMLSNLIWLPVMKINTLKNVDSWIEIATLAVNSGLNIFESEISGMTLNVFCRAIVNREAQIESDDLGVQKLNKVLEFLTKANQEHLSASILRGLIDIESKWYNDPNNAIQLAAHHLKESEGTRAKFILSAQLGRLYQELGDKQQEIDWFKKALAYKGDDHVDRIDVLLQTATSIAMMSPQEAVIYCLEAVELAETIKSYAKLDLILLLDELAVSYWLNGEHIQTFLTLEDIVAKLFEIRKSDFGPIWIRLFSLTGHLTGYCSAMMTDGKPPQIEGEDFFAPYQGMFNNNHNDFTQRYNAKHDSFILVQLAYMASALGEPKKAYGWALKAFDEARKCGSKEIFHTISSVSAHFAIINFKPTEAFEAYLYNGAIFSHFRGTAKERSEHLKALDTDEIFSDKPSEQWSDAEDTATTFATVPLFMMLLTAVMTNRHEKNQMRAHYFSMLSTFHSSASDPLLFELVTEISSNILNNTISVERLGVRANTFGQQEKRNLQTLCLLGVIHLTRKDTERLTQLINIVPFLQKLLSVTRNSLEYTLAPFVQAHAIDIVRSHFVGDRSELEQIESEISSVDKQDIHWVRTIINTIRKVVEVDIPSDRQRWLDGADI